MFCIKELHVYIIKLLPARSVETKSLKNTEATWTAIMSRWLIMVKKVFVKNSTRRNRVVPGVDLFC